MSPAETEAQATTSAGTTSKSQKPSPRNPTTSKSSKLPSSNSRHGNSSPATFPTPPSRRSTKHPTDDQYRKQWEAVTYEPGWFKADAAVYITDRGERVRSKSEQLIANLLYRLGIPYRYEYPIEVVVNGHKKTWRPDFTILDVKNRRELYLEHFGKLDDQEDDGNYARNAFEKMKIYEENGMYDGGCMIYSFETNKAPLDIKYVERKVRRALGI